MTDPETAARWQDVRVAHDAFVDVASLPGDEWKDWIPVTAAYCVALGRWAEHVLMLRKKGEQHD